ncbi:energy transducer TonB, partial [Ruminococcus sp.]|uniref:energy transducer TonB n=1 Tax=Ruminococcus sp. TaxID=41978 RepID=UPI002E81B641
MKKQFLLLVALFAFLLNVNAQKNVSKNDESTRLYQVVEQMPEFPGGHKELVNFLSSNVQYPAEACRAKIQGRAIVSFVVEPDGSVTNVGIAKGAAKILDDEAMRVVGMSP